MQKSKKKSVKITPPQKDCLLHEKLLKTNNTTFNSSGYSSKDIDETAISVERTVPVRKLSMNLMKEFEKAKTRPLKKLENNYLEHLTRVTNKGHATGLRAPL